MKHPTPPLADHGARAVVKRTAAGVVALASAAAIVIGATMALFSDTQTSDSQTFTAGTVSVGLGTQSVTCQVPQIMPGDSSAAYPIGSKDMQTCVYDVKYTGNAPAWLAVDVRVDGGTPSLYTASANGFQVLLRTSTGLTLVNGTSFTKVDGASSTVSNGVTASNLLLSSAPAAQGDTLKFNIDYLLPELAPNALQGGQVSVTLTFHAVQSDNQPIGSCVAGRQCNSITWS